MNRLAWVLVFGGCVGTTSKEESGTPTGDSGCEVLDVGCTPTTGATTYPECPEGYTCSGIPAYWCYKGPTCSPPECLPPGTLVDTPSGPTPVAELTPGDLVWTLRDGAAVVEPILEVRSRLVPSSHQLMSITLADGRSLTVSPGHPTADGRRLGDLRAGDLLDGAEVLSAERVVYGQPRTWDLLPAGPTGAYLADGVWLGSTLR
jgi:Hint domain